MPVNQTPTLNLRQAKCQDPLLQARLAYTGESQVAICGKQIAKLCFTVRYQPLHANQTQNGNLGNTIAI